MPPRSYLLALCVVVVLTLPTTVLANLDRSAEIQSYITGLQDADIKERINTAKLITNSGLNDHLLSTELVHLIQSKLASLPTSQAALNDTRFDELAWFCKALASSGDLQYEAVLQKVRDTTTNDKVRTYAHKSLTEIGLYAQRNQVLNNEEAFDASLSVDENRYVNLLRSQDKKMKRDGAKYIMRANTPNPILYDILNEELLANFLIDTHDRTQVDALAWMIKALTSSHDKKYVSTFLTVLEQSKNAKLIAYARGSITTLNPALLPPEEQEDKALRRPSQRR